MSKQSNKGKTTARRRKPRAWRQSVAADWRQRETISVEEYGQIVGISRNSAYEAVKAKEVATIKAGRRIRVCVAALVRQLNGELPEAIVIEEHRYRRERAIAQV